MLYGRLNLWHAKEEGTERKERTERRRMIVIKNVVNLKLLILKSFLIWRRKEHRIKRET